MTEDLGQQGYRSMKKLWQIQSLLIDMLIIKKKKKSDLN